MGRAMSAHVRWCSLVHIGLRKVLATSSSLYHSALPLRFCLSINTPEFHFIAIKIPACQHSINMSTSISLLRPSKRCYPVPLLLGRNTLLAPHCSCLVARESLFHQHFVAYACKPTPHGIPGVCRRSRTTRRRSNEMDLPTTRCTAPTTPSRRRSILASDIMGFIRAR